MKAVTAHLLVSAAASVECQSDNSTHTSSTPASAVAAMSTLGSPLLSYTVKSPLVFEVYVAQLDMSTTVSPLAKPRALCGKRVAPAVFALISQDGANHAFHIINGVGCVIQHPVLVHELG